MKTFALTLLLIGAAIASNSTNNTNSTHCDPYIERCDDNPPPPQNYMGWYWSHGALSWVQTFLVAGLLIGYKDALAKIGNQAEIVSYSIVALNFIGYIAVSVKWSITAAMKGSELSKLNKYKMYYKLLRISRFYSWFLSLINIGWFLAIILQVLLYHNFGTGVTKPSIIVPVIGLSLEVILRVAYSFSQFYSMKLMMCWAYDWPEQGRCSFEADLPPEEDLESEDTTSL